MMTTPTTPDGVFWRGRFHRFAGGADDLATQERALDSALQTLQRGEAALLMKDGRRLYADDEHTRRAGELRAAFEAQVTEVAIVADEAWRTARGQTEALEVSDPADTLAEAELSVANARAGFVERDWVELPIDQLVPNARAVLVRGERGLIYVHWRGARRRYEAERAAGRQAVEVATLHRDLTTALADPKGPARRKTAEDRLAATVALRKKLFDTRLAARGGIDGMVRELKASGRYARL
jgi:hypothetical protein